MTTEHACTPEQEALLEAVFERHESAGDADLALCARLREAASGRAHGPKPELRLPARRPSLPAVFGALAAAALLVLALLPFSGGDTGTPPTVSAPIFDDEPFAQLRQRVESLQPVDPVSAALRFPSTSMFTERRQDEDRIRFDLRPLSFR